jgi:hypothetical protein
MGGDRRAGELGADLADLVAQGDDPVEPGVREPVEVLGRASGDVDAPFGHHADRVRMQRLRVAARAARPDRTGRQVLEESLSYL